MKLKHKYHNGEPVFAGRSLKYFGVHRMMEASWFHRVTSAGQTNATPNPTPTPLRVYSSRLHDLRRGMYDVLEQMGFTRHEAAQEWANTLDEANVYIEKAFMEHSRCDFDPIADTPKNREAMLTAGEVGWAKMQELVSLKTGAMARTFLHNTQTIMQLKASTTAPPVPASMRKRVIERDTKLCDGRTTCMACQQHIDNTPHCDHIISRKDGGPTVEWNLHTLCSDCNLRKGAHSWPEYLPAQYRPLFPKFELPAK
jgi:hypothetical protein